MNRLKSLQQVLGVALVIALLVGCGAPVATPMSEAPAATSTSAEESVSEALPGTSAPAEDVGTPSKAEPETVRISTNGDGEYATLEDAVENLAPYSTIVLEAGQYELSAPLIITKSLTIQGAGVDLTTISKSSGGTAVLAFEGDSLTIEDLSLERTGQFASDIMVVVDGKVHLEGCRIAGGAGAEDDSIKGDGLVFGKDTVATLQDCIVENNGGVGILVSANTEVTIDRAICSRNQIGIAFVGESTGVIRRSTCADNQRHGVLVGASAQVEVVNNTIERNGASGIQCQLDAAGGEIRGNTLRENNLATLGSDIEIWGAFAPELADNHCSDDTSYPSLFGGDLDGIVFMWLGVDLPDPSVPPASRNDCDLAICTGVTTFDMTCESP